MTDSHQNPPAIPRAEHAAAVAFVSLVTALLFAKTVGKALFFRDLLRWSYPGICFFQQSLSSGEIPLWCPHLFLGYPFLAEAANAVLYPLGLLHLLGPAPMALKWYPAVHYFLTGYLMWRLLKEWGLASPAAMFGGLVWMCSGYLVSMHLNFNYLVPAAWYPGLLFAFHRLLVTRQIRWLWAAVFCWSLLLFGGDPQAVLFAGVLLAAYAILTRRNLNLTLWFTILLLAAVAGLTLILLPAQLLPSLEFGTASVKLQGYDFSEATAWSFHPLRLLEFIWPGLWGPIFPPHQFWAKFLRLLSVTPWAGAVYLGLFPMVLGLFQFRFWRQPPVSFLIFTALLFFLLALGYYSPLYRLLWHLCPPYRIFRYPEKHLVLFSFALAGLAAFGFQNLLQPEAARFRQALLRAWLVLSILVCAVGLGWLGLKKSVPQALAEYLEQAHHFSIGPERIRASLHHALSRAALIAGIFLCVLWLGRRVPLLQRRLAEILLALTAADLLFVGWSQLIVIDPHLYHFPPSASRLLRDLQGEDHELFRIYRASKIPSPLDLAEPMGLSYEEKLVFWNRHTLQSNLAMAEGWSDIFGYDPAETVRSRRFSLKPLPIASFQMLNVKFLLDGLDFAEIPDLPELSLAAADEELNLAVLRNEGYFPRAFWVDGVVPAKDEAQFLDLLADTDLRHNVILFQPDPGAVPGHTFLPARILSYRNQKVVIELTTPGNGHLVLSDSYFPGWQALVDGKPARILRANYLVRAVAITPGRHRVVFSYQPWSWRIGKNMTLVSLLFPLVVSFLRRKGGRWHD